jgi:TolB-like protein/Tfp pilus assembly protein PilF
MANGAQRPVNPNDENVIGEKPGRPLDSWKEIASWFNRSEKTVRRWEEREGMPVHRQLHNKRGSVYAYPDELRHWWESRKLPETPENDGPALQAQNPEIVTPYSKVTSHHHPKSRPPLPSRSWLWLLLAAGSLMIGAYAWYIMYRNVEPTYAVKEPLPYSLPIHSLAVLPLTDLGADSRDDYFADGITEELISELGKLGSIRIISRTSIMQFKKSIQPLPEIGRRLNVDALVEGTVRRSGDRVRVTARLVSTAPERLIWAKEYEGDMHDVLALQSDVARDVAGNIQTTLARQQAPKVAPYKRLEPKAYEAYLRGRYFLAKRTAEGMNTALNYFHQATQLDPLYAQAFAGLADTYNLLGAYEILPPEKAYPPALELANRALALDDSLSEAYSVRAISEGFYELDWGDAERDFQHAIALDPSSAMAHHGYGEFFTSLGDFEHAISEIKAARELDPLSLPLSSTLGRMYREAHKYDEAVEQCKQTLNFDSNFSMGHWCLGQAYLAKGEYLRATAELERANALGTTPLIVCDLGCAYAASGKKKEARAVLNSLKQKSQFSYVSPYLIASIYSALGEKDAAFRWLETAYDRRDGISYMLADPMMDPLRSDPRFQNLVQRLHVPKG